MSCVSDAVRGKFPRGTENFLGAPKNLGFLPDAPFFFFEWFSRLPAAAHGSTTSTLDIA
jgi:hypothetical protein